MKSHIAAWILKVEEDNFPGPKVSGSNMVLYLDCYHLPNHLKDCLHDANARHYILSAKQEVPKRSNHYDSPPARHMSAR
jgi:hypothetical protein